MSGLQYTAGGPHDDAEAFQDTAEGHHDAGDSLQDADEAVQDGAPVPTVLERLRGVLERRGDTRQIAVVPSVRPYGTHAKPRRRDAAARSAARVDTADAVAAVLLDLVLVDVQRPAAPRTRLALGLRLDCRGRSHDDRLGGQGSRPRSISHDASLGVLRCRGDTSSA